MRIRPRFNRQDSVPRVPAVRATSVAAAATAAARPAGWGILARCFGALAALLAAALVLSGCVLIQTVQQRAGAGQDAGSGSGGPSGSGGAGGGNGGAPGTAPSGGAGGGSVPNIPGADTFYGQQVQWGTCSGEYAVASKFECATVDAPLNWDAPSDGEPIQLALIRLPAKGQSRGALFTNPGGPGASGIDFVGQSAQFMFDPELLQNYDIVSWDPRGVGHSSAVKCVDDAGMDKLLYGVPDGYASMSGEQRVQATTDSIKEFAASCEKNTGPLLGYVDTISTVHDLDMLRYVVGAGQQLNYFGFSYGTDIGAHYVDLFPQNVGRVVLDGATDPTLSGFDVVVDQTKHFSDAIRAYLNDCLTSPTCPFAPAKDADEAAEQISGMLADIDKLAPRAADGRVLTSAVVSTAMSAGMYDQSGWPVVSQAFSLWIDDRDPSGFFMLSDSYYGRDTSGHYSSNMFEAFAAINCLDYPLVTDPAKIREFNEKVQDAALVKLPVSDAELEVGDITCENWPVKPRVTETKPVKGAGAAPVLVLATTNDPATPVEWAKAVATQLESASLLILDAEGHIAYDEHNPCINDKVDAYFTDGTVPSQQTTTCR